MTTGYTREQLAQLAREMDAAAPMPVTAEALRDAQAVIDITMAGTELGILLRLATKGDDFTDIFLNCVIVLELVFCIIAAKEAQGWKWMGDRHMTELKVTSPTEADLPTCWPVKSFRLGSGALGATFVVTDGRTDRRFYIRRKLLAVLLAGIAHASERGGWWGDSMELRPNDGTRRQ
jgi:hypothetical protein